MRRVNNGGCVLLAAAAFFPALFGCAQPTEPIWIGAVSKHDNADGSEDNLRGIRIAVDQANRAGGINGRRVEVRILVDSGRGEVAVRIAREFVADKRVVGVLGHEFSSAMIAATPVYEGKLAAVTTGTSPELSGISPWVFRIAQSDSALALDVARLFYEKGWRRLGILYVNDVYGRGLVRTFVPAFRALGGEVVRRDPVTDTTTDFAVYVRAYKQSHPHAVFVVGGPGVVDALLHATAAQQLEARIVGANGWTASLSRTAAPTRDGKADGMIVPREFLMADSLSVSTRFRRDFAARFGYEPDVNAALSYDGALAMLEAIRRGGADRAGVKKALAGAVTLGKGTTGPISFQRGERVGGVGGFVRVARGHLSAGPVE